MKLEANTITNLITEIYNVIKNVGVFVNPAVAPEVPSQFINVPNFPEVILTKTGSKTRDHSPLSYVGGPTYTVFINDNLIGNFNHTEGLDDENHIAKILNQMFYNVFAIDVQQEVVNLIEDFNLNRVAKDDRVGVLLEAVKAPNNAIEIISFKVDGETIWTQAVPYGSYFNPHLIPTIGVQYRNAALSGVLGYEFPKAGEYHIVSGNNNVQMNRSYNPGGCQPLMKQPETIPNPKYMG